MSINSARRTKLIFNLYPGEWPTYYSLPMWPGLPQLKSIIDLNGIIGSPSKIKNILEICSTWISEIWRETSAELIKKSFIICGVHNNHLRDSNNNIQIRSDSWSLLNGSVVLAISFSGVCSTPAFVDQAHNANAQFALAVRVLWSYFVDCSTAQISDFELFYSFIVRAVPLLSFDLLSNV